MRWTSVRIESHLKKFKTTFKKLKIEDYLKKISAHADVGPRSRACARETLCSAPHQHEPKKFDAQVCRIALNHLPQLLRTHFKSLENSKNFKKK